MKDFRKYYQQELIQLKKEYKDISQNPASVHDSTMPKGIEVGSRIICTHKNGKPERGRVFHYETVYKIHISFEGRTSTKIVELRELENLSTGIDGNLERRQFQINLRVNDILEDLKNAEVPVILQNYKSNYIQVVQIDKIQDNFFRQEQFDFISFVHFQDNKSYRMKVLRDAVKDLGYYHIEMDDDKAIDTILRSSERAFLEARQAIHMAD